MTETTDERRREVAARLRDLEPWDADGDIEVDEVLAALGMAYGYTGTDLKEASVQTLADLVDRPTCTNAAVAPQDFRCGRCGAEYFDVYAVRCCPHCGAEVVDA